MRDEDGITIVNSAKTQMTHADYVLAQEEYDRKKALARQSKQQGATATPRASTSSIAARLDRAQNIRDLRKLLANPEISQEDRNTLERRLHEEEMAEAFSPR